MTLKEKQFFEERIKSLEEDVDVLRQELAANHLQASKSMYSFSTSCVQTGDKPRMVCGVPCLGSVCAEHGDSTEL